MKKSTETIFLATGMFVLLGVLCFCIRFFGLPLTYQAADEIPSDTTTIIFTDDSAKINGEGAKFDNDTLMLSSGGRYVLSGELNGQIRVEATKREAVFLELNGLTVTSNAAAPLYIARAKNTTLTLNGNNVFTFTGSPAEEKIDGAIYSRDDLTIDGNGTLTVLSETGHGIVCNDSLSLLGGNLSVTAAVDGIHAHDAVTIQDISMTVSAGDDGIHAGNNKGTSVITMNSGSVTIESCYEGIEANDITITGGTVEIFPTDDGINAWNSIHLAGGDVTIINPTGIDADGLDSNGSIYISGGSLFVSLLGEGPNSALDYGSENGGQCVISGGTVLACGSSQMAEGFSQDSPQGFIMKSVDGHADDVVTLTDANGQNLLTREIPAAFTSILLSAPDLTIGDTVSLKIGDTETEFTIDNSILNGNPPAGGMAPPFANGGAVPKGLKGKPPAPQRDVPVR